MNIGSSTDSEKHEIWFLFIPHPPQHHHLSSSGSVSSEEKFQSGFSSLFSKVSLKIVFPSLSLQLGLPLSFLQNPPSINMKNVSRMLHAELSRSFWVLEQRTQSMLCEWKNGRATRSIEGIEWMDFHSIFSFSLNSSAIEQRLTENYTLLNRKQITESAEIFRPFIYALEFLITSTHTHRFYPCLSTSNSSSKYHSNGYSWA